jgi:hypothetical protein
MARRRRPVAGPHSRRLRIEPLEDRRLLVGEFDFSVDVGGALPAGDLTYDPATDTYTLTGGGADVGGNSDQFHFAYNEIDSDRVIITARVTDFIASDNSAKVGVMIRDSLNPDSIHAFAALTPGDGFVAQGRDMTGGESHSDQIAGFTAPIWVRLERQFNTFTGYCSADGLVWNLVSERNYPIPMTDSVYVGLAVSSQEQGVLATVTVTDVEIEVIEPNQWDGGTGTWGDSGHWLGGQIPDASSAAIITGGNVTIDGDRSAHSLDVSLGAHIIVDPNATFSVGSWVYLYSANMDVQGELFAEVVELDAGSDVQLDGDIEVNRLIVRRNSRLNTGGFKVLVYESLELDDNIMVADPGAPIIVSGEDVLNKPTITVGGGPYVLGGGLDPLGVMGYWPFEDPPTQVLPGTATTPDLSGNGHHANRAGVGVDPQGVYGAAYRFAGDGSHISTGDLLALTPFTTAFWAKRGSPEEGNIDILVAQGDPTNFGGYLIAGVGTQGGQGIVFADWWGYALSVPAPGLE